MQVKIVFQIIHIIKYNLYLLEEETNVSGENRFGYRIERTL